MLVKSKQPRKRNLNALMKRMEKAGKSLQGINVDSDPKKAELELRAIGIQALVKKEGIQR